MKSFYSWLKKHKEANAPIGDLARDILVDEEWPKRQNNPDALYHYLRGKTSWEVVLTTFKTAYIDYQRECLPRSVEPAFIGRELAKEVLSLDFVYVLRADTFIKVGKARDVDARVDRLQTSCPFPVTILRRGRFDNAFKTESALHRLLLPYSQHNEWFSIPERVLTDLLRLFDSMARDNLTDENGSAA
jgi:uncharacterized protein YozE (UPF0346 family)